MKKIGFTALTAVLVLAVAGCNLEPPAMGHLSISVPLAASATVGSRALGPARAITEAPAIRVYVQLNGIFIKSGDGKDFFQSSLVMNSGGEGSNTVTIDLPPSSGYQVFVALGAMNAGWVTKYYGGSDSFDVAAGVLTNKTIVVGQLPASSDIASSAAASFAAVVNGDLWKVVDGSVTDGVTTVSLAGLNVSSLASGEWFSGSNGFAPELWVNTDHGIFAVSGSALTSRSATFGASAAVSGATVADVNGNGTSSLILYFYGTDAGFAFTSDYTKTSVDSSWSSGTLRTFLDGPDGSSFKDFISDPGSFVKASAFVIDGSSSYGLVSTALGTYFYSQALQDAMKTDVMQWVKDQLNTTQSPFLVTAMSGGKSQPINVLAMNDPASPTMVYAGTEKGLFGTSIGASPAPALGSLNLVVSGPNIKKVAASGNYVAYVDAQGNLVVLKKENGVVSSQVSYPFYAFTASPSGIGGLTFYQAAGALRLAVACADAFATLPIAP